MISIAIKNAVIKMNFTVENDVVILTKVSITFPPLKEIVSFGWGKA